MSPVVSSETNRLVQVFLTPSSSGPGVFEVTANDDAKLFCTCPGFIGRKVCKHTKFVQAKIDSNKGTYPLEISSRATDEDAEEARLSKDAFRKFVLEYGRIEVY